MRRRPPQGDPPQLSRGGGSLGAGGAQRAPLQLELARLLVPLHLPVPRRSGPLQDHSPHIRHHSAQQQRLRPHSPCGLHIQLPAVYGRMCLRAYSGRGAATLLHAGAAYQLASGQAASGGWGLQLHRWPAGHAGPCRAARPADAGILDRHAACRDGSPALRCPAGPSPQQACLHPHSNLRPVSSAAGSLTDIGAAARQSQPGAARDRSGGGLPRRPPGSQPEPHLTSQHTIRLCSLEAASLPSG